MDLVNMDWGLFFQALSIGVGVLGIMIAGFWRMWALIQGVSAQSEKRIAEVKAEANERAEAAQRLASVVARELSDHKIHTAETYVSKSGLREITDQIMDAIGGLGSQITGVTGRIDRMLERPAPVPRTRTT